MPALTFLDARNMVLREVCAARVLPATEEVPLEDCQARVLAEDITADRDYPPFHRSVRDGFAVRSEDMPGRVRVVGEARAGDPFEGSLKAGEAVEIMTGAPVPEGADAVVMVEHCVRRGNGLIETDRTAAKDSNIAQRSCEARAGAVVLKRGTPIDYSSVGWLATTGHSMVNVYARPRVAVIATGDEIVPVAETPAPFQIRNSNAYSLAAQVRRAGGVPVMLPVAKDSKEETAHLIRQGLDADLLLLSGGVSAGKYDFVEAALADCGARVFFDRVAIQPGQPLVFGAFSGDARQGKFFFGLPGNPASTMITFELFGRAALSLLAGMNDAPLPLSLAKLSRPFHHKPGMTRFLPAEVSCTEVTPVDWQGSGDVPSICRANAFLVADPDRAEYAAGDLIPVLWK